MSRTMAALNNANVSVYPIDARGLSCNPEAIINIDTMKSIADATGGKAFYNRNDLARGVRDALDDSREVYLLTYSPNRLAQDGAYHTIRVQTTQKSIQLRYRRGYYAPGKEDGGSAEDADRLTRVVASPLDTPEVGVQAHVETGTGAAGEIALQIRVDATDLTLAPKDGRWAGALRLEAIQIGATGERLGGFQQTAEVNLKQETYQRALEEGLPFEMKFPREAAAVSVRIAVVDLGGGHVGSLTVALPQRPAR
jgi:hypothetical protein